MNGLTSCRVDEIRKDEMRALEITALARQNSNTNDADTSNGPEECRSVDQREQTHTEDVENRGPDDENDVD